MNVNHPETWDAQEVLRDDLSVRRNDGEIQVPTGQRLGNLRIPQSRWLVNGYAVLDGRCLDRRVGHLSQPVVFLHEAEAARGGERGGAAVAAPLVVGGCALGWPTSPTVTGPARVTRSCSAHR